MTIRIGILGYGNLGKGVECAIKHNPDMELKAVFKEEILPPFPFLQKAQKFIQ